jgi:DNA mismatch endonuclease (patch repair protein)
MDILGSEERSALMARVRSKDTGIEVLVRRALHRLGFRYRLGGAGLPGRPDIVLPKHRTVVFVHGCFWHGHDCPLYRLPKTRTEFWKAKIGGNRARDERNVADLKARNWKPLVVWECAIRGKSDIEVDNVIQHLAALILRD